MRTPLTAVVACLRISYFQRELELEQDHQR